MDKDKKIKEMERKFEIISDTIRNLIKENKKIKKAYRIEKLTVDRMLNYQKKLEEENKALNKENDGLREQNIELLEMLADFNELKIENKKLKDKYEKS